MDTLDEVFIAIITALVMSFLIFFLILSKNSNVTNNLICEKCDTGRLSYVDTLNYEDGTTLYRYECDTCGRLFRTEKWRGK